MGYIYVLVATCSEFIELKEILNLSCPLKFEHEIESLSASFRVVVPAPPGSKSVFVLSILHHLWRYSAFFKTSVQTPGHPIDPNIGIQILKCRNKSRVARATESTWLLVALQFSSFPSGFVLTHHHFIPNSSDMTYHPLSRMIYQ